MVTNSSALEKIADGPDGMLAGLGAGKILIDMSTVSPAMSRGARRSSAGKRRRHGGRAGLRQRDHAAAGQAVGDGGRPRAKPSSACKPVLLDIGPKVTHVGDNGLALVMKIATNLSLAVQMLAFSEGVLLAEKSGIARETAVDVLTHSAIASPMVQYRGPVRA